MLVINNPMFFHIGYHRTGTTFLQKTILPKFNQQAVLSEPESFPQSILQFLHGDLDQAGIKNAMQQFQDEAVNADKPVIVSAEGLHGSIYHDDLDMADRIHNVFPNSRILICIRSQYSMIPSQYQYLHVKSGGSWSYQKYVNKLIENNKLDYHKMVSKYQSVFGKGNVKILLYEMLKQDQEKFLREFLSFINLTESYKLEPAKINKNERYSLFMTSSLCLINK